MIAHSLNHPNFGKARGMHGATYVIDAAFSSDQLNEMAVVIDIVDAKRKLREVLDKIDYKNLDDLDFFENELTTTEFLARWIFDQLVSRMSDFSGHLKITLLESHEASASFEGQF